MAAEIRPPPGLLTALRAVAHSAHGDALLDALSVEMARRRSAPQTAALAWTLPAAIEELAARPHATSLFGAIRLLQGAQPGKPALGYSSRAEDDAVRIDQTLLLGFAPSEVDAVVSGPDNARPKLSQSAIGLLGPNGALPYRWTEHAHDLANTEYRSQRDVSFHAWLNVMQRRQIGLLYRAWSDAQAVTAAGRSAQHHHPIADRLRALAGVRLNGLQGRDAIDDSFKMAFAATLSRRVRNPGPLAAMLAAYFEVPVRIEEFAAHWLEIPPDQRSALGVHFATLATDVVIGSRVRDTTTRFRIVLGPLSLAHYRRFLPNGASYAGLRDMVSLYVGVEYEWDLVPVLERQEVPSSRAGHPGLQLGWSAWLGIRDACTATATDTDTATDTHARSDARDLVLPMAPRLN